MVAFTKIFVIAICLGFIAAGVAGVRTGWEQWQLNRESGGWPEAQGSVQRAWVDAVTVKTGNRPSKASKDTMYGSLAQCHACLRSDGVLAVVRHSGRGLKTPAPFLSHSAGKTPGGRSTRPPPQPKGSDFGSWAGAFYPA